MTDRFEDVDSPPQTIPFVSNTTNMGKSAVFSLLLIVIIAGAAVFWLNQDAEHPELIANRQHSESPTVDGVATADTFLRLVTRDPAVSANAIRQIDKAWHPGSTIMLFEASRIARSTDVMTQAFWLAESKTGQSLGRDVNRWNQWIWNQMYDPHPQYAEFKSKLYSIVDPTFSEYFQQTDNAKIRLDEVVFGGVRRDGIPPLKSPAMIRAEEASWLDDAHVVFGVFLNGDARCYPKRILAWHEMFKDTIGGQSVCGVY